MVDFFNINQAILFAIDTLSPRWHIRLHITLNSRKVLGNYCSLDDVRCLKGKGDDDPPEQGWVFCFFGGLINFSISVKQPNYLDIYQKPIPIYKFCLPQTSIVSPASSHQIQTQNFLYVRLTRGGILQSSLWLLIRCGI